MNTIGILARSGPRRKPGPVIRGLVEWLRERGVRVCLDEATAARGASPR